MRSVLPWLILGAVSLVGAGCSSTEEKVVSFDAELTVQSDQSLLVEETISVNVRGRQIKRGIYREILNTHRGLNCAVRVLGAWRDGEVISPIVETDGQRTKIRLITNDRLLSHGTHTFRLQYEIERRVDVQGSRCELAWDVTGIRWGFPIEAASADVTVPEGVDVSSVESWSTLRSRHEPVAGEYSSEKRAFRLTAPSTVQPGDGLVVMLSWPAG